MPKEVIIDSNSTSSNSNNIDALEKEIAELERQMLGEEEEGEKEEEITEEEVNEDEPPKEEHKEEEESEGKEEKLSTEEETFKKRYGDSRRFIQKLQDEIKFLKEGGGPVSNPPTSEEDLNKWVEENPEIASIVEAIASKKAEERFETTEQQLKDIDKERFELKREKGENNIRKKHEDYDDIKVDDAFHSWAAEQPKIIQDALYEDLDDWASVSKVIDMYKVDKGLNKAAQKEDNKKAVMSPNVKGETKPAGKKKNTWSESKVARLSVDDYIKYEDEIDNAIESDEFVYDLSG